MDWVVIWLVLPPQAVGCGVVCVLSEELVRLGLLGLLLFVSVDLSGDIVGSVASGEVQPRPSPPPRPCRWRRRSISNNCPILWPDE
jgi:hypothetical protein